jgi:hypothetical protein
MEANIADAEDTNAVAALLIMLPQYQVYKRLNLITGSVVELEDAQEKVVNHINEDINII